MNKLKYLFLLLFIFNACSYEPILSKKKYNFNFTEVETTGNKFINKIIQENLLSKSQGNRNVKINLKSNKDKKVISSNKKGDPVNFKIKINVDYIVYENNMEIIKDNIFKEVTYNNINDKFELSQYEDNTVINLSNNISDDILTSLLTLD